MSAASTSPLSLYVACKAEACCSKNHLVIVFSLLSTVTNRGFSCVLFFYADIFHMLSWITSGNLLHLLICFSLYQVLWKHHALWNSLQWMSNGPTGFQAESCCWQYLEYPLLWSLIPCCSSNIVLRWLHKHQTHLLLFHSLWTLILSLTQFSVLGPFSGYCLVNLNCRKRVKVIFQYLSSILLWTSCPGMDPILLSKMVNGTTLPGCI